MTYLKETVMDSIGVDTDRGVSVFPVPKAVSFIQRLFCKHKNTAPFVRIDYRAGPGSFADNYAGIACLDCARILNESKIY